MEIFIIHSLKSTIATLIKLYTAFILWNASTLYDCKKRFKSSDNANQQVYRS